MAEQTCVRDPSFEPISNDNDIDRYMLLGSVQPKELNLPSTTVFEQCSEHCSNTEDFLKQRKSSIKRSAYFVGGGEEADCFQLKPGELSPYICHCGLLLCHYFQKVPKIN